MIAPPVQKQTAKPQVITIGLDEHGQIQAVNVGYQVHCGKHVFTQGVTWHDQSGGSIHRADDHMRRLLVLLVDRIIADTRPQLEE